MNIKVVLLSYEDITHIELSVLVCGAAHSNARLRLAMLLTTTVTAENGK